MHQKWRYSRENWGQTFLWISTTSGGRTARKFLQKWSVNMFAEPSSYSILLASVRVIFGFVVLWTGEADNEGH
jgi:hypothetical protein